MNISHQLINHLKYLKEKNSFRQFSYPKNLIDFCSNDYLGFARSKDLITKIEKEWKKSEIKKSGSTGSRLISGNDPFIEELESYIANYHKSESGLIFNSGYDANIGLFSSVPQRGDTVLYDEYSHASIRDGIRLCFANSYSFYHNDIKHLESKLKKTKGNIFVVVESVYSMDGDFAPLTEIADLCKKYLANLIVDEAHATGIFGTKGEGRVVELGIEKNVFARVHTFGKAMGCHGAIVLGKPFLRDYLINFSRSFIYTTALPYHSYLTIKMAYNKMSNINYNNLKINNLIYLFKDKIKYVNCKIISSHSPIQCIIIPGNNEVCLLAKKIQNDGFDVRPIRSPTVPKGKERLRICIHEFNTEGEIAGLVSSIKNNLK